MAAETKVVRIGQLQIITGAAAVRIVTIRAAHLGFANRVVVRKIGFGILLLVAPQAVFIHLPARLDRSRNAGGLAAELATRLAARLAMNGVAVAALHVLRLVRARKPIANMVRFRVAAQADTVRLFWGTVAEADDLIFRFGRISTRRYVQTARPVALFARNLLHRVRAPAKALGEVGVTSSALFRPRPLRSGEFHELAEVLRDLARGACLGFVLTRKRWCEQEPSRKEKKEEQSASPHSDLPKALFTLVDLPQAVCDPCYIGR